MKRILNAGLLLSLLGSAALADNFCKSDGFALNAPGYSYCYSSNWFGSDIDPFAANADTNETKLDSNWIYAPTYNPSNPHPTLLLFLPGHGSNASAYTDFMRAAQAKGYYVIGLAYQNGESLQGMCGSFDDCFDEVLAQNVYLGTNNGFYSSLAGKYPISDQSINHRLGNLLQKLQSQGIAGGFPWTQFYNYSSNTVNWNKIVVAGHSEGGATAAWITKNKPVLAGLTFAAPYSMLDSEANGATTVGSGFSPYAGFTPPTSSNTSPVPYLQCATPADCAWADKLHITLDQYDTGYDNFTNVINYNESIGSAVCTAETHPSCNASGACTCTLPIWPGLNMERAAYTLKPGQQKMMSSSNVPSAATVAANTWFTVSEVPTKCVGHQTTIVDGCYPTWMPTYWNELLASVLPPQH